MAEPEFKALFCERFHCAPSEYQEEAFRKCLFFRAWLLAAVIRKIHPDFFFEDFKFIGYLGSCTSVSEAVDGARNYHDANLADRRFWRTALKMRVSGRKAKWLVYQTFAQARHPGAVEPERKGADSQL